ncbi:MAG: hypothetical protein JOZ27_07410 [Caulobacteraceae bacterium]|nr:hypothetical protein [Caulobacteraceae bacterium]
MAPEFIQGACNGRALALALEAFFLQPDARLAMRAGMATALEKMGGVDGLERVDPADAILAALARPSSRSGRNPA